MPRSLRPLAVLVLAGAAAAVTAGVSGHAETARPVHVNFSYEAERMARPDDGGTKINIDNSASNQHNLSYWSNRTASLITVGAITQIQLRVRGDQCDGAPKVRVLVDGLQAGEASVPSTTWSKVVFPLPAATATSLRHVISVVFPNDHVNTGCDRNLYVDRVAVGSNIAGLVSPADFPDRTPTPTPAPTPVPTPSADAWRQQKLWVDPNSKAAQAEARLRAAGQAANANLVHKIAAQSAPVIVGHYTNEEERLNNAFAQAATDNSRVIISIYGIPWRDGLPGGEQITPAAYKAWIDNIVADIGNHAALTILEPTATAFSLPSDIQNMRFEVLRYASAKLGALPNNRVYLDAGNSAWKPVDEIVPRLLKSGIQNVDGFSLNASNFRSNETEIAYGRAISAGVGNKPFIIDTSRNGNGPPPGATEIASWCNPPGMALGQRPTLNTGIPGVDAFIWVHPAGVSDNSCNGYPKAGDWVDSLALEMARNAKW